jgi:hypothetical protein
MRTPGKGTGVFGNYDPPQIKLAPKWCWLRLQSEKQAVRCGLPVIQKLSSYRFLFAPDVVRG